MFVHHKSHNYTLHEHAYRRKTRQQIFLRHIPLFKANAMVFIGVPLGVSITFSKEDNIYLTPINLLK